jgi:hypothetical protein
MEYQELKNYGKLYTGKTSPKVLLKLLATVPKELGFIGTPKFLTKLQGKEGRWKKAKFTVVEERGITHEEFLQGIRYGIAFYSALVATCGKEKALDHYTKLTNKLGIMMYEEFMPSAEDFLACPEPWDAFKRYYVELFRTFEREGIMDLEVLQDSDTDLHMQVNYCAFEAMWRESGHSEAGPANTGPELIFYPRLVEGIGGCFQRESCLCLGDATCDWHFLRDNSV